MTAAGGGIRDRALEALLAIVDDPILIANAEGALTLISPAARELLDPENDLEARTLAPDRATPIPPSEQPLRAALQGRASDDVTLFVQSARGDTGVVLSASARPLHDGDGRIIGALVVYRRQRRSHVFDSKAPRAEIDSENALLVLVVDDEALVRRATAAILRRAGYAVLEASNAEQALSHASAQRQRICALVLDIVLDSESGLDLAERLRPLCPAAKLVFTSGYEQDRSDIAGARFVQKPFTPADLLTELARSLRAD